MVAGLGRLCKKSGSSRRLPQAPRQDCLREEPLQVLFMSSGPLPQNAQESVARQETKKEDPGSSSPQSHDRRPVRVSRGHQFPHATPPVCAGKFSEVQRGAKNLPSSSPPSPSCLLRAREPGSGRGAGRGGANRAGAASCCRGDSDCWALRVWPGGWGPGWFLDLETRCNWQLPEASAAWPSEGLSPENLGCSL